MEHITTPNIEKEMLHILNTKPMTRDSLKELVLLGQAMEYSQHACRHFTEEDARAWVEKMNPPARWTMEQTTAVMLQNGYDHKPWEFFAVMNALASDYGATMAKFGADRPDIWASLADDWLDDADAEPGKIGRYWRDIVKH